MDTWLPSDGVVTSALIVFVATPSHGEKIFAFSFPTTLKGVNTVSFLLECQILYIFKPLFTQTTQNVHCVSWL